MQEVKVLMIFDAFDVGGTETHVLSLAKALKNTGVSVFVAANSGPLESEFRELQCPVFIRSEGTDKLIEWIRRHNINLIHAHMQSSAGSAADIANQLRIPLIYTIHGQYYSRTRLRKLIGDASRAPAIVSVSKPIQEWLGTGGIDSVHIPNGIDMKEFRRKSSDLRTMLGMESTSKVLLYASRLEYEKYDICRKVINVFQMVLRKEFPDTHLLIAGGGLGAGRIEQRVLQMNSSRIHFLGNRKDMVDVYSASDFVIGTGRVALEAISCKRPVIAIGTRGVFGLVRPDNFSDALDYYFCDHKPYRPLSHPNIAKAIIRGLHIVGRDADWGNKLRQKLKPYAEVSMVAQKLKALYEQMLLENR